MERMSKTIEISVYDLQELRNENIRLKSDIDAMLQNERGYKYDINKLEEENKKLKEENEYRKKIADVLPEGEGHIAEETIQDLQKRIDELVWFEKEYHRSRDRIKKLEWVLEHEYGRKVPY